MLPEIIPPGLWYLIFVAVGMIAWRIWGHHVTRAFRDMERRRATAELQAMYDRANPNSHFRQSVEQINEDVPAVEVSEGQPDQYRWNGMTFASREDAEAARWQHVLSEARGFYQDLDRSFGNRIGRRRSPGSIDGSAE